MVWPQYVRHTSKTSLKQTGNRSPVWRPWLGGKGAVSGGWGGFVDLAGLDAGVDEEAYADAEGDKGAGGSAEDVALVEDGGEGDEEEGDTGGGAEEDDAGEADIGAAADQADGGTALGGGDLGCGGRKDEAFGDGGEALLAFELALAGIGPAADGDDAEDHDEACYGNDERAVEGFANAVIENHERLLNFQGCGTLGGSLFAVGL